METSASFEARSAPSPYPAEAFRRPKGRPHRRPCSARGSGSAADSPPLEGRCFGLNSIRQYGMTGSLSYRRGAATHSTLVVEATAIAG